MPVVPGYSDHTLGIEAAVLSVGLGARIIEKHFTLDHNQSDFRDHQLSATPDEMRELARRVREAELLLGNGEKRAQPAERDGLVRYRRSVAARRNLSAGSTIGPDDLCWVRPGDGIPPGQEHQLIGRALKAPVAAGALLALGMVETEDSATAVAESH